MQYLEPSNFENSRIALRRLQKHLVDVAPAPVLARLEGLDQGMVAVHKVLGGVSVLRVVAAADVAAREAEAEMDPGVAHLQALLAAIAAGGNILNLIEMRARCGHEWLLTSFSSLCRFNCSLYQSIGQVTR